MTFNTLAHIDPTDLLVAFNAAFSDYIVPVQLTAEQLATKLRSDKTDLGLSAGAFRDGQLVGFILHSVETIQGVRVAWNGGTGVIPAERGQHLTSRMYNFIWPLLRENQVQQIHLEVIATNTPAIQTYRNYQFDTRRRLDCYKGALQPLRPNPDYQIRATTLYDWDLMESFWDIQPSWQNARHVVQDLAPTNVLLGGWSGDRLVGYLIFNPVSKRVQQFAVHPDHRKTGVASSLFEHLRTHYTPETGIINVDQVSDAVRCFLEKAGLKIFLEQLEMVRSFVE